MSGELSSISPTERDTLAFVLHVKRGQREQVEYVLTLLTEGLQFATSGDIEWDGGWALDDTDDAILTGLGVLHGEYPAQTFAREAEAWNAARAHLGEAPHPVPSEPRPERVTLAKDDFRPDSTY